MRGPDHPMGVRRGRGRFLAVAIAALFIGSALGVATAAVPGGQSWAKLYDGPANDADWAYSTAASPDGSKVFVTGQSLGTTSDFDYATVAYDAVSGARLWTKRYNGGGNGGDGGLAVGLSPDGSRVFVTGWSTAATFQTEYVTIAYDASDGTRLWRARYHGGGSNLAYALVVSPDGRSVYVSGGTYSSTSGSDFGTVAYDSATGARLWTRRYNGPANGDDSVYFSGLGVSPDGSTLVVTGYSAGATSDLDYATIGYDAVTGKRLWAKRYNGRADGADTPSGLSVSGDSSAVFVTGSSTTASNTSDYATVAYDLSTGDRLWVRRFDGPASSFDFGLGVGTSPDGSRVFVTGGSAGPTDYDYATLAYDASTGAEIWMKRYNGPTDLEDRAVAVGVSPDGMAVYVTGSSYASTKQFATLAYEASTGARLWVKRYDAPSGSDDTPWDLAVAPDGSGVFVTGYTEGPTPGDFATVAYAP